MARLFAMIFVVMLSATVLCKPVEENAKSNVLAKEVSSGSGHSVWKRFVNPAFALGANFDSAIGKIRTKRSAADDCEKLELCKLHARSNRNFIAAFELYFVNKENAKLWDHRAHSIADCERRFPCYDYRR